MPTLIHFFKEFYKWLAFGYIWLAFFVVKVPDGTCFCDSSVCRPFYHFKCKKNNRNIQHYCELTLSQALQWCCKMDKGKTSFPQNCHLWKWQLYCQHQSWEQSHTHTVWKHLPLSSASGARGRGMVWGSLWWNCYLWCHTEPFRWVRPIGPLFIKHYDHIPREL